MSLTPQTLREQGSNDELDKSSKALLVWMVLLLEEVAASRSATDTNLCSQPLTQYMSVCSSQHTSSTCIVTPVLHAGSTCS